MGPDLLRLGAGEAERDRRGTLGLREAAAALAAAGRGGGGGSSGLLAGAGDLEPPGDLLRDLQPAQIACTIPCWLIVRTCFRRRSSKKPSSQDEAKLPENILLCSRSQCLVLQCKYSQST